MLALQLCGQHSVFIIQIVYKLPEFINFYSLKMNHYANHVNL